MSSPPQKILINARVILNGKMLLFDGLVGSLPELNTKRLFCLLFHSFKTAGNSYKQYLKKNPVKTNGGILWSSKEPKGNAGFKKMYQIED